MEIVLPDAEVLAAGRGGLQDDTSWPVCKNSYGPNPETLFLQPDFGIITKMGMWVKPTPDYYMSCMIRIADDQDLPGLINAARPLMPDGAIPSTPSCFDTTAMLGDRADLWPGGGPIPEEVLRGIREQVGAAGAGFDYGATLLLNPRSAVHAYLEFFDRIDDDRTSRAYALCNAMVLRAAVLGGSEYRAHASLMDAGADQYSAGDHAQRRLNERVNDALDPRGIVMPGRCGTWPARLRGQDIAAPWKD